MTNDEIKKRRGHLEQEITAMIRDFEDECGHRIYKLEWRQAVFYSGDIPPPPRDSDPWMCFVTLLF